MAPLCTTFLLICFQPRYIPRVSVSFIFPSGHHQHLQGTVFLHPSASGVSAPPRLISSCVASFLADISQPASLPYPNLACSLLLSLLHFFPFHFPLHASISPLPPNTSHHTTIFLFLPLLLPPPNIILQHY